ncbi:hypothetical protein EK904_004729 [Melospiza melodia maxima]|nr:hypothetical protein EK904_004729 [Melospiza melodia maxima]
MVELKENQLFCTRKGTYRNKYARANNNGFIWKEKVIFHTSRGLAGRHPEARAVLRIQLSTRQTIGQSFQQVWELLPSAAPGAQKPQCLRCPEARAGTGLEIPAFGSNMKKVFVEFSHQELFEFYNKGWFIPNRTVSFFAHDCRREVAEANALTAEFQLGAIHQDRVMLRAAAELTLECLLYVAQMIEREYMS